MEAAELIEYGVVGITCLGMFLAARSDIRAREVPDVYWASIMIAGSVGGAAVCILGGSPWWEALAVAASQLLFMYSVLCETRSPYYLLEGAAVSLAGALMMYGSGDPGTEAGAASVLFCLFYHFLYAVGIVRGGADAKCLMSLSVAIPSLPEYLMEPNGNVPDILTKVFSPSVSVLFLSSVLSVAGVMVYCLIRNRGSFYPGSSHGYMMPVRDVRGAFVWPSEDIRDGVRTRCQIPDDDEVEGICQKFEEAGEDEIYVTPMVPFILPMAVSLILVLLVGDPLLSVLC